LYTTKHYAKLGCNIPQCCIIYALRMLSYPPMSYHITQGIA